MSKSSLSFAIVGCGKIAQRHAEQIYAKANLIAVCDIVKEKADALAKKYNAIPYYSFEEMLHANNGIDIISVCTPNGIHAIQSVQALSSGFHVLCEKPMALSVEDCKNMITAAERNSKKIFVVKQNRYNPPVAAVKKVLDEGRLGRIYSVQLNCFWNRNADYYQDSWRGTKLLDGGTLFTQFSHFIDLLLWMIGDIKDVKSFLKNFRHQDITEFEDTGVVIVHFNNGAIGTINYTVNSFEKNMEGSITIFGEKGTVKIGGQYLNELEYQNIEGYKIENIQSGNLPNHYGNYVGSMSNHHLVYDNVINVLQNNEDMNVSAAEAMKTVELITKIYQTANVIQ